MISAATMNARPAHPQNTSCHGPTASTPVDSAGAKVGTRMKIAMTNDIIRAICSPS